MIQKIKCFFGIHEMSHADSLLFLISRPDYLSCRCVHCDRIVEFIK